MNFFQFLLIKIKEIINVTKMMNKKFKINYRNIDVANIKKMNLTFL